MTDPRKPRRPTFRDPAALEALGERHDPIAQLHAAQHAVQLLKQQAKQVQKTEKGEEPGRVRKDGAGQEERRARTRAKADDQAPPEAETPVGAHDDSPWAGKFINRNI